MILDEGSVFKPSFPFCIARIRRYTPGIDLNVPTHKTGLSGEQGAML
jgi:hypothetical protein